MAAKKRASPRATRRGHVKRWFHVDRDAKVLRLYQDKVRGKGGPKSASLERAQEEGEITLQYTVIKLYTGGREPERSRARAPTSASRCSREWATSTRRRWRRRSWYCAARPWTRHCACAAEGRRRVDGVVLAAQVLAVLAGLTVGARARRRDRVRRSGAADQAAGNGTAGDAKAPTKAQLERAFSLFGCTSASPSEKRGGGDGKVTATELRFLLTSLGDKLSDDQVDAMVQQAGQRGVAGDIDVAQRQAPRGVADVAKRVEAMF